MRIHEQQVLLVAFQQAPVLHVLDECFSILIEQLLIDPPIFWSTQLVSLRHAIFPTFHDSPTFMDYNGVHVHTCSISKYHSCGCLTFFLHTTFLGLGESIQPHLSMFQTKRGLSILFSSKTSWYSSNQFVTTSGLADFALNTDNNLGVFMVSCLWHFRNPWSHLWPACLFMELNPAIPFMSAYSCASVHISEGVNGKPACANFPMWEDSSVSSSWVRTVGMFLPPLKWP